MSKLPRLEDWFVTEGDQIIGHVFNHPTIADGEIVTTSRVAELNVKTGYAITKNTRYILGRRFKAGGFGCYERD